MANFDGDLTPIIDFVGVTLCEIKADSYLELWRQAEFNYNQYQGDEGYDYFYLRIGLRASAFRTLGSPTERTAFENKIYEIAQPVVDASDDLAMRGVQVYPIAVLDGSWRSGIARPIQASTDEVSRIWKEGYFRLFLSHSSADKQFAADLKKRFSHNRIDTFVAHEDIEPNLTWQDEIKLALASCHALLFVASRKSCESVWCHQEVGWALGRGLFVTSYSLNADPVGLMSALQGWSAPDHVIFDIRKRLLEFLVKEDKTEPAIREPLVQLLLSSKDVLQAEYSLGFLEMLRALSQDQVERASTVLSLPFVARNKQLKSRILSTLVHFGYSEPKKVSLAPSADEYDPFADE